MTWKHILLQFWPWRIINCQWVKKPREQRMRFKGKVLPILFFQRPHLNSYRLDGKMNEQGWCGILVNWYVNFWVQTGLNSGPIPWDTWDFLGTVGQFLGKIRWNALMIPKWNCFYCGVRTQSGSLLSLVLSNWLLNECYILPTSSVSHPFFSLFKF